MPKFCICNIFESCESTLEFQVFEWQQAKKGRADPHEIEVILKRDSHVLPSSISTLHFGNGGALTENRYPDQSKSIKDSEEFFFVCKYYFLTLLFEYSALSRESLLSINLTACQF